MAASPLLPAGTTGGNPSLEGGIATMPPLPGTDMTGICFRDQLWLNTYPLDRNLVFDYFALSPFYDWSCNNEQLRSRSIHPLDPSHLSKMTGNEYMLSEVMEPHLFVIRKVKRDSPEKTTAMLTYYILDGSIYQAPQLSNVFAARIVVKEAIDFKELKRVDHILASLQRKLPAAPAPPPFPEGYAPPASEAEKGTEDTQNPEAQLPTVDPIIDQGPAKRMKFQ
ncbi:hypothetical protein KFK09_013981 [Dendrobium nobile]|uniref:Mediator of RNA polymerase II transcription subunit 6 n=1 Tax=Dendrobium nobile TaxID=94219 RepID=A0A8T3B8P7_DENNO|nr:hypothetical protein KFK09_013981 [Dendrobium nobile]